MVAPKFDGGVLAFAAPVSLLTVALFGLAPALRASCTDVAAAVKEETAAAGRSRRTLSFTNALVMGQVAFSLVCPITAALFFRSIERAYTIDPGFQTSHLGLVVMDPAQAGYSPERVKEFYRATRERIATLPGVESVSWASGMLFWNTASRPVVIEGAETRKKSENLQTVSFIVSQAYFRTLDIPLVVGRTFNDNDREGSLPVAVINRAAGGAELAGRRPDRAAFSFRGRGHVAAGGWCGEERQLLDAGRSPQPCVYLPQKQNFASGMTLYVRSQENPANLLLTIQREVRMLDSNIAISDARTGAMLLDQVLWGPKVGVALLGMFGSLALASVGLYGVIAYSVTHRRRDIGVRMTLGAMPGMVLRLVVDDGMKLVGWGIALGLGASLVLGRGLSHMLFGVSSADSASLGSASATPMLVALAACYLPARAATRIDPMKALRQN
jgi:predicted permease